MNQDSNNLGKVGDEGFVSEPDPAPEPEQLDWGDLGTMPANAQASGAASGIFIGDKVKLTPGHGLKKCSHSSSQLRSHSKTFKLMADVANIGKQLSSVEESEAKGGGAEEEKKLWELLKDKKGESYKTAEGDSNKDGEETEADDDTMDVPVELRKIAVETSKTSPMEVREQDDNIVIIGGGYDAPAIDNHSPDAQKDQEKFIVRTTKNDGKGQATMTFVDGILTKIYERDGSEYPTPGYGKHLNLRVWQKYYYKVAVGSTQSLMVDAGTGYSHQTYFWRHGLYVGTVDPGDGLGAWEDVDHWSPKMATDGSGEETTEVVNTIELSVCVSGSPVLKTFVMVDE